MVIKTKYSRANGKRCVKKEIYYSDPEIRYTLEGVSIYAKKKYRFESTSYSLYFNIEKPTLSSVSALNMGCPPYVVILCPMMMKSMNNSLEPWDASRAG
jgi:hypothetical protein